MPRRIRRRRIRRRARRGKRLPRLVQGTSKLIKCSVVNTFAPTYTSGAIAAGAIQGNSVDDPFTTGSNKQPLGYDQWKALYKKAKVLGCKVKMTVHNGSTGALVAGITAVPKNQGTTALTTFQHYLEAPGTKHKTFSPDVDKGVIVNKRSTKKMLKLSNIKDAESTEIDLVSETAPTDNYYFHYWSQPLDETTALTGVQLIVQVEYVVLLYDPIIPARSTET